jgi:HAD superfamily hydrolase (TIGR01484 family)
MVSSKVIVLQDVDGCLTPNIDAANRAFHPAMASLQEKMQEIRAAGGLSVLSTGRPLPMVTSDPLLKDYVADYAITSAGVEIAKLENGVYVPFNEYEAYLLTPPEGKTPFDKNAFDAAIKARNDSLINVTDQSAEKVSGQRLGYYVENDPTKTPEEMRDAIIQRVKDAVGEKADCLVIPSLDPHHGKWNVDIMPSKASKLGAAKWLISHVKNEHPLEAAIVWGDSGNDVPAMQAAMYRELGLAPAFIAPGNAAPDVVEHLRSISKLDQTVPVHFYDERVAMDDKNGGPGGLLDGLNAVLPLLERAKPPVSIDAPQGKRVGSSLNAMIC